MFCRHLIDKKVCSVQQMNKFFVFLNERNFIRVKLNARDLNAKKKNVNTQQQNWTSCKYILTNKCFLRSNLCSPSDDHIQKFVAASVSVCEVIMAGPDEITEEEAHEHKYRDTLVLKLDEVTNKSDYEYVT